MSTSLLALTVFFATAVEGIEALTIVLAIGVSRGWRDALWGAVVASVVLGGLVALFGGALAAEVPLGLLRLVVGLALLVFGLGWLRKAVMRAAGRRPRRNEVAAFEKLVGRLSGDRRSEGGWDPIAFVAAFKGVFLEGIEAAIIVITVGAGAHRLPVAFSSAGAAVVGIVLLGIVVHRPLARIPENALKLGVGVLLSSFGTFWIFEGLGVQWPGSELAILYLVVAYSVAALVAIRLLGRSSGGDANRFSGDSVRHATRGDVRR